MTNTKKKVESKVKPKVETPVTPEKVEKTAPAKQDKPKAKPKAKQKKEKKPRKFAPPKFVKDKKKEGQHILEDSLVECDKYVQFRTVDGNGYKLPRAEYKALQ